MKKNILFLFVMAVGFSSAVYGQEHKKDSSEKKIPNFRIIRSETRTIKSFTPPGVPSSDPFLPARDTVIMRGEEIEVGAFFSEQVIKEVEIIGFGKSKKSDFEKGSYIIKLKPKQTITYEFKWNEVGWGERRSGRIVYVAKTEEEKKQLEEKLKASWQSPFQRTTYQYKNPNSSVKISVGQPQMKK